MKSGKLGRAWQRAVEQLEANDKGISHFVFKYQAMNHPRVAEHRILADELITRLKQQGFMEPYH